MTATLDDAAATTAPAAGGTSPVALTVQGSGLTSDPVGRLAAPRRDNGGMEPNELDADLLNAVQWSFPLTATPYADLADRLGRTEDEVLTSLRAAKAAGVLRQLSAIFDTRALGYSSALVAAKVDPDHIDDAAAVISGHPGVSHNYKRNHAYNLWYTLAVPPGEDFDAASRRAPPGVGRHS